MSDHAIAAQPAVPVAGWNEEARAALRDIPTSILSDCLERLPGMRGLVPFYTGRRMVGPALTVSTAEGDNLAIHQALEIVQPGDVIVVDGGGYTDRALIGEIMKAIAESRGAEGYVIDGAIRDVEAFRESDFPCFARGCIHRGPYKNGPGRIGEVIAVGGARVAPGDIVVGDADGVLSLPPSLLAQLLADCAARIAKENEILAAIRAGTYDGAYARPAR